MLTAGPRGNLQYLNPVIPPLKLQDKNKRVDEDLHLRAE